MIWYIWGVEIMHCELCGRETSGLKQVNVEGTMLKVCVDCARFGTESDTKSGDPLVGSSLGENRGRASPPTSSDIAERLQRRSNRYKPRDVFEGAVKELVEDYHIQIQKARNSMGLSQDDLARKLNERKSVVSKLETKAMWPDDKLVRKLERVLNITLMEDLE